MKAASERGTLLARLFWIVLWIDVLIGLPVVISLKIAPVPQYDLSDALLLLLSIGLLGGAMTVIALTRNPVAHGCGLALAIALPLLYGDLYPLGRATPSDDALRAGHGYFRRAADRALADAIVAGDGAKAVSLVPAVNPNTVSWKDMTFMRLALERGHADVDPDVVAALLKAGANPDQDSHLLFHFMAACTPGRRARDQGEERAPVERGVRRGSRSEPRGSIRGSPVLSRVGLARGPCPNAGTWRAYRGRGQ